MCDAGVRVTHSAVTSQYKTKKPQARKGETGRRVIALIFVTAWTVVLFTALFVKWDTDSTLSVWEHYTNISWSFQAIVYLFILVAQILIASQEDCTCRGEIDTETYAKSTYFLDMIVVMLFWPAYATAWIVYVVVFIIIKHDPELITHLFKIYGGEYEAGTVIVGNELYHSLPVIVNCVVLTLIYPDVMRALYGVRYLASTTYKVLLALWGIYVGPIFFLLLYALVIDYKRVYATEINMAVIVVVVLLVLTLIPGLVYLSLWLALPYYRHSIYHNGGHVDHVVDTGPRATSKPNDS